LMNLGEATGFDVERIGGRRELNVVKIEIN
jgi:hypothetical protein